MSAKGYISIHRTIWNDELWFSEPFTKAQAWIDLLLMANYEDNGIYKRACVYTSIPILAKRWKWSENKVRRYLKYLKSDTKVRTNGSANGTTITIVNYDKFQKKKDTDGSAKSSTNERLIINNNKADEMPATEVPGKEVKIIPWEEDYGMDPGECIRIYEEQLKNGNSV